MTDIQRLRPIRVMLVDDDALVRSALRGIMTSADDITVVAEAADSDEACRQVQLHRPDLVVMDVRLPHVDALRATFAVMTVVPPPRVVVLTNRYMEDDVIGALESGATGVLLKDTPPLEMIDAVREVSLGGTVLSPKVTRCLVDYVAGNNSNGRRVQARNKIAKLSPREVQVLVAVSRGLPNADIGAELYVSEATVKAHVSRILVKLNVTNRVQVAVLALEAKLH